MINLYVSASTNDRQYDMAQTLALVVRAIPHYDMRHIAEVRQAIGHYKGERENTIILTLSSDRPWLAEGMAADLADRLGQETVLVAHHSAPKHVFSQLRSEEHTSELQSRGQLVCRLLLVKQNVKITE